MKNEVPVQEKGRKRVGWGHQEGETLEEADGMGGHIKNSEGHIRRGRWADKNTKKRKRR